MLESRETRWGLNDVPKKTIRNWVKLWEIPKDFVHRRKQFAVLSFR